MKLLAALSLSLLAVTAQAALPQPTPQERAKADEAKARAAWSAKIAAHQLCEVQDRVAAQYFEHARASGKAVAQPVSTPACVDPGPFVYTPTSVQPREGSGAHSPAEPAAAPPSSSQTEADADKSSK